MVGEAMDICLRVLKESNKNRSDSYSGIDHIPYHLSGLSRAHFFRQPRKIAVYFRFTVFCIVVKVPVRILFAF